MTNPEKPNLEIKKNQASLGAEILKKLGLEQWADSNLKSEDSDKKTTGSAEISKGRKHSTKIGDPEMPGKKPVLDPDDDLGGQWGYHQDHGE